MTIEPTYCYSPWLEPIALRPTLARIAEEIAAEYFVTVADIRGPDRTRRVSRARQAFMHAARLLTGKSYPCIGRWLARDHTTVMHGERVHAERMGL